MPYQLTRNDFDRGKLVKTPSFHHGQFMGYDISCVLPDGFEEKVAFDIPETFADFVLDLAAANLKATGHEADWAVVVS